MRWLKLLSIGVLIATAGCRKNVTEEREVETVAQAFKTYYLAVIEHDYDRYAGIVCEPMGKERFMSRLGSVSWQDQGINPICQITLGINNRDAKVLGVSPWTSRESEFKVRKIGNKFKIAE